MQPAQSEPYHERQSLMRCGVHALNNALQQTAFTTADLDSIADGLSKTSGEKRFLGFSAYRAPMGLGQYNVSVLEVAVSRVGRELKWHDRRKPLTAAVAREAEAVLVNRSSLLSRHWFAVRRVGDLWYNLDSKLSAPAPIGDEAAALAMLNAQLSSGCELLVIVPSADNTSAAPSDPKPAP